MKRLFRIASAALLALSPTALAQPMGPPHGGPGGPGAIGHTLMLLHDLKLTEAQQQQLHALLDADRARVEPLMAEVRAGHANLEAKLYATSTPSLSELTSQASQLAQLHAKIEGAELETILEIRALLTSDQLARMIALHDKLESLRQQTDALLKPAPAPAP